MSRFVTIRHISSYFITFRYDSSPFVTIRSILKCPIRKTNHFTDGPTFRITPIRKNLHFADGHPAPAATQTFPSKRVCQMIVYPLFPRNLIATHVFSPQKVCRGNGHRTSQPLQTQNPSKVYPKTIIPHLSTDTSAVSKHTNVQGDGEISVRKTFRQGRLCKFPQTPYRSSI